MALSDYNNSATYTFTNARGITSGEWSVPTSIELAAFGGQLGITTSNFSGYGLKYVYWSSTRTLDDYNNGYCVIFRSGEVYTDVSIGYSDFPVRLARTF